MPIILPPDLPAAKILADENISVLTEAADFSRVKILLLNLMPNKIETETQLARMLGGGTAVVELHLLRTATYVSKNTPAEHLEAFYKTFEQVRAQRFDGMIITGAPVEQMEFEEVAYWAELCEIMEWTKTNVRSTYHICWGAQAGLYYHYRVPKYPLPAKLSGVFSHTIEAENSPLFRGIDGEFLAPQSRNTCVLSHDIKAVSALRILARSREAGVHAVATEDGRQIFVTGHPEYDADTLKKEYLRDIAAGLDIAMPVGYFPDNDATREPSASWRESAKRMYANWVDSLR